MTAGLEAFLGRLAADAGLWADFTALCDCGGRLAGTESEARAFAWTESRLAAIGPVRSDPTPYAGWRCGLARVTDLASGRDLGCAPLLGTAATPPEGLVLETLDLGRGAPEQVAAAGEALRGRAVLARHEYPFAAWTVHRRVKLQAATAAGAAAFLIVQPEPGVGPVSGSSGRNGGAGIPALGISAEAGALLREGRRIRLQVQGEDLAATTPTLVLDLPGRGPDRVVLSAHLDGHPLGESAIDNATGLAAALALARAVAPVVERLPRGLTLCVFGAEEWALSGSRAWLAAQGEAAPARMALNLNLDSIAGGARLTALTSGFAGLGPWLRRAAAGIGVDLGIHLPLMRNSDHANFADHGIPALRLVAGFDAPESALRFLLTGADTRALVPPQELKAAALTAGALLWAALTEGEAALAALRG
ncbi:M28 family peptidase [Siccirubricoccus sp. G192]|uniref:M28 family peptidase n=1 Tax=Siccirubricoccus sp. G192 TaxID=2849651 RepID=UPI001C2BF40A|nr:M28 family peptidase [Siccirubricoccus sp. G192]MBV1797641.1 M28 family peptidase [Siccirubricoccus sp. G192]